MQDFGKNQGCPPSQVLLDFQNGDLEVRDSAHIRRHLAACEFCSAEVEFYSHYPIASVAEPVEPARMPQPLRELAEALLNDKTENSTLEKLMKE